MYHYPYMDLDYLKMSSHTNKILLLDLNFKLLKILLPGSSCFLDACVLQYTHSLLTN